MKFRLSNNNPCEDQYEQYVGIISIDTGSFKTRLTVQI